jgi:GT2 family glycosyltransferase
MSGQPSSVTSGSTIALVTVLYNCEKYLPLFFECLCQQDDGDFVVIIIDNASRDRSLSIARDLAARHAVRCHLIANADNLGIAAGNNQGIEEARGRDLQHIVLINNDIGCPPDLIAKIRLRAITAGHRAWTCLAYLADTQLRWYGGGRLSYWRARGMHFDQSRSLAITEPVAVTYAPTCLMYLHTSVFDEVGLMDPRYFVYYDDTDFCRRLQIAGIELVYDPTVAFRHYVGGSSGGELSDFFLRINTRNKFIYIRKHYTGLARWIATTFAIGSKLAQLASNRRRKATWLGLRDAYHLRG